jgi:hypothetical protein
MLKNASEGVPAAAERKGLAFEGVAVRAGSRTSVRAHLEHWLRDSVVPQSRPRLSQAVREAAQAAEE